MTYDPDRDARAPADVSPNRRPYERERTDVGAVMTLSILGLFIAFGLWFYLTGGEHHTAATDDRPAASQTTTGSGTREAPLPANTPTPPTVPSPARE